MIPLSCFSRGTPGHVRRDPGLDAPAGRERLIPSPPNDSRSVRRRVKRRPELVKPALRMIMYVRISMIRRAIFTALLLAAAPHAAHAQTLIGRAVDRATQQPIPDAEITLVDAQGEAAASTRSGADGTFRVTGPAAGDYRVAARKLGYQNMLSNALQVAQGQELQVEARLAPAPQQAPAASVTSPGLERGITGRVVEAGTTRGIAGAAVTLLNERGHSLGRAIANAQGDFQLPVALPGRMRLRADRVGYRQSISDAFTVVPSDSIRVELAMSTDAVVLAPLTVVASSRSVARNSRLASFEWRAEHNAWGRFMGPEQIARIRPMNATDVLQQVPGLRVEGSGLTRTPTMRGWRGSRCVPTLYVDGHQSTDIGVDELVSGPDVAAVEVYEKPFEAPAEFMPSSRRLSCGVVVVWTKRAM
jgi:hypothetical protein